jgi:hypothetical protein
MTTKSIDDFDRIDALCELLADAFVDASDQEIDQTMAERGLDDSQNVTGTTSVIEEALNQSLKKKTGGSRTDCAS